MARIASLMISVVLSIVSSSIGKFRDSADFFNEMCVVLAEEPTFDHEKLLTLWVHDFSWNTRETPFDLLAFTNVTIEDIQRYRREMGHLLVSQPAWRKAKFIMISQQQDRVRHSMMLFPDKGQPGRFIGVPNFREVNPVVYIKRNSVFLIPLQMIMLSNGALDHLIIMDCDTGETSLSHKDTLAIIDAPTIYMAALRVPFPVRYSHLYTGIKIPDIPPNHPPQIMLAEL